MAEKVRGDKAFVRGLKRLFSSDAIVRHVNDGKGLKVIDTDGKRFQQALKKDNYKRFYQRYLIDQTQGGLFQFQRKELFKDYEAMEKDPILNSALDIYADECLGGETIIPLLDGSKKTIKELHDENYTNFWIYGLDSNKKSFIPVQCERVANNGLKQMYLLTLDDGTKIKATDKHIWVTAEGNLIKTSDLEIGEKLKVLPTRISNTKGPLNGYKQIKNNNKFEFVHRIVARNNDELIQQREAIEHNKCAVHHASFNKLNNSPEHLTWLENDEHLLLHHNFNQQLWANPKEAARMKKIISRKVKESWKNLSKEEYDKRCLRRSKTMKDIRSSLTNEELRKIYSHPGSENGMYKNGHKVAGDKNGRWISDKNRIEDVDINQYISDVKSGMRCEELEKKYNILTETLHKINKIIRNKFNINSLRCWNHINIEDNLKKSSLTLPIIRKEINNLIANNKNPKRNLTKIANSLCVTAKDINYLINKNGYRTFSEFANSNNHQLVSIERVDIEDAYDLVNAGKTHIYAIETNDGGKLYTHNSTTENETGDLLVIKSDNNDIKEILNNLFYDILNIEFNLWSWIRNMCKYGDTFLQLDIQDEYGVVNVIPVSVYDIQRVEGEDPLNPKDYYFTLLGNTRDKLMNFQVAHFRMFTDSNYFPYGRSMIEGARKPWKQLSLMEDAMMVHRIMRAPEKRVFKIDIGNIPPKDIDTYMNEVINKMKKAPYIDPTTGEYNLKFNLQNMLEDFFLPVRGGDTGTSIETLNGTTFDTIDDIEYIRNKMMAGLKIPKAFLNYEEDIEGKATLAAMDLRFARTIERIQKITISELYKIATIHLYCQGYTDDALVDFDLELTSPSLVYEEEKIEIWDRRASLVASLKDIDMLCEDYIYEKILGLSEDEVKENRKKLVMDKKRKYRLYTIENDGEDPVKEEVGDEDEFGAYPSQHQDNNDSNEDQDNDKDENKNPADYLKKKDSIADELFSKDERMGLNTAATRHKYKGNSPLSLEKIDLFFINKTNNKQIIY